MSNQTTTITYRQLTRREVILCGILQIKHSQHVRHLIV